MIIFYFYDGLYFAVAFYLSGLYAGECFEFLVYGNFVIMVFGGGWMFRDYGYLQVVWVLFLFDSFRFSGFGALIDGCFGAFSG